MYIEGRVDIIDFDTDVQSFLNFENYAKTYF